MADTRNSFVEFETASDLKTAVEKLDRQDFKGSVVECTADVRAFHSPTVILLQQKETP